MVDVEVGDVSVDFESASPSEILAELGRVSFVGKESCSSDFRFIIRKLSKVGAIVDTWVQLSGDSGEEILK